MENKQELMQHLKMQIIKQLKLDGKQPADIGDHDPLFVEGLGLDSIDALELIVLLQQEYQIKLKSAEEGQHIFRSISTMADFILDHQQKQAP